MIVDVKMSGLIARYLPPGAEDGRADVELPDGATLGALMRELGLPGEESYLIIVNDTTVPRDERENLVLSDGDKIAIVPPLRGG